MWANFIEKVEQAQQDKQTNLVLRLAPKLALLPLPIQRYDEPLFPFGKAIIHATRDFVCAYWFDLASYLALGASGAVALERTIRYAGSDTLKILHGPFANADYSAASDATGFGVDAITLSDKHLLDYYLKHPPYGGFYLSNSPEIPTECGVYHPPSHTLHLMGTQSALKLHLTDETVLYTGKFDDFAQEVRLTVQALRVQQQA